MIIGVVSLLDQVRKNQVLGNIVPRVPPLGGAKKGVARGNVSKWGVDHEGS